MTTKTRATAKTPTPAGPVEPAGEPRPGPLTPPEQPQAPEPAPEPPSDTPEPDPVTEREAALADVRRRVASGELGVGALLRDLTPQQLADEALDLMAEAGLAGDRALDATAPLSVWEAIAEVTRRIGAVTKDRRADAKVGGYRFRGIDEVLTALHPVLGEVGLVLMPGQIVDHRRETRSTSGSPLNVTILTVRYTLIGPDGTREVGESVGEGADAGDKGTGKAMSQAYKSFVFQAFSIPTEQSAGDEPDLDNPPARPFTEAERARAREAWAAAQAATTFDKLAQVRSHAVAEGLLDVPIAQAHGDVALGILFDQRRTELDRATARVPA